MGRRKKIGSVPINGKFVPILHDELDSPAYMALGGNSAKLYGFLKRAARNAAHRVGSSEREVEFDFTYSEARKRGFVERTFIRCVKDLWSHGFIQVIKRGGLRGTGRSNSKYQLSGYWKTYGIKDGWKNRSDHEPNPFLNRCEPEEGPQDWG